MKQGRFLLPLALAACLALAMPAARVVAAPKTAATTTAKKPSRALRQFTGVVTALDKSTITVEKGGKAAKTMVFVRDAEMKTTGELAKDARVTVYWREESGKSVARKVVVKDALSANTR
jgi:hypothetical protein